MCSSDLYRPVRLALSAHGTLEVLADAAHWNQTGERVQRMQQLSWQREDLVSQYQTVLAAVRSVHPCAVGSPTTLPAPLDSVDRPDVPTGVPPARRAAGVVRPVSADEVIELSDVDAEASRTP